jgi:putative membrane protein
MNRMSAKWLFGFALLGLFVPRTTAANGNPSEQQHHPDARSDEGFVRTAAEASMSQVDLGKLAEQHSQNEEVRRFAKTMVEDHTRLVEELKQLGNTEHVALPTSVSRRDADEHRRLNSDSGANFDRSYAQQVVSELERQISEFKTASANATRPNVKEFAQRTIPSLESQLGQAKQLENRTRQERR